MSSSTWRSGSHPGGRHSSYDLLLEGAPLVPTRRHQDTLTTLHRGRLRAAADQLALPGLVVAFALAVAAALIGAARPALLGASVLLAVPSAVSMWRRDLRHARPGGPVTAASADLLPAATGADDAAHWAAALQLAAEDPRARPLSAVKLRLDAPGLTGPDRAQELQRLQAVASVRWREILRPGDTLAQLGPSEFAVLLPRCDGTSAEAITGRLQQAVPEAARSRAGVATSSRGDAARLSDDAARALAAATRRRDPLTDPVRLQAVAAVRAALGDLGARDAGLDGLAVSTASLLGTPSVVITLIDDRRVHLAGAHGVDALDATEDDLPDDLTLCRSSVTAGRPVLVSDTARHGVAASASAERRLGIAAS
ncbi:MAG: hypothetical protein JHD16_16190, partial [Solirubrobacteraceae bacterium]|nr:hypothetical protein [Solirubrobacteraceae bacterium]